MKCLVLQLFLLSMFTTGCSQNINTQKANKKNDSLVVCTMDVKQCADGSFVSRMPPDCKFAACEGEQTD